MATSIDLSAIQDAFDTRLGIPRPNWSSIAEWVEANAALDDLQAIWTDIARQWLTTLTGALSTNYRIHESDQFLLLSALDDASVKRVLRWCEVFRRSILERLDGVAKEEGYGKHVLLAFESPDTYYDYLADSYPEDGEYGGSGGVFINSGYGHIAIWTQSRYDIERTILHELTHSMLRHLPLPAWLNEGTTQFVEDVVLDSSSFWIDHEIVQRHRAYWNTESLDAFWSGSSFDDPDDGQELSYHLAEVLVRNLCADFPKRFLAFLAEAHVCDAGDAAARKTFGTGLAERAAQFLGPGKWQPRADYGQMQGDKTTE